MFQINLALYIFVKQKPNWRFQPNTHKKMYHGTLQRTTVHFKCTIVHFYVPQFLCTTISMYHGTIEMYHKTQFQCTMVHFHGTLMVHFKCSTVLSLYRDTSKVSWYNIVPWYFKIYHGMQHGTHVPRYKSTTVHPMVHLCMGTYNSMHLMSNKHDFNNL